MTESQPTDYADTPAGWAKRWQAELKASKDALEKWHKQGRDIVKRFRDERDSERDGDTRWNLFTTNVQTQMASLYGQTPKVSVSRRYADANDNVARVASELLERLLNADIEKDSDTFEQALEYALQDRLLPGFGTARVRYVAEFEHVEATEAQVEPVTGRVLVEAVEAYDRKTYECVETDYVHWQDVLWSPARVWHEVRWLAFRSLMGEKDFNARFDPDGTGNLWAQVPKHGKPNDGREDDKCQPWDRVEVWECWDKESKRVQWYVDGWQTTLDSKDDPLGLEGFFPCSRPLIANWTTDKVVPRPDFVLAMDLYNEVDLVSTRITLLERAIRVVGVYDKTNPGIQRLLGEAKQNELIPVDNWAAFAERGGITGAVAWLPLEQIVEALTALRDYRRELVDALYQVTGMSDIMRGASDPSETATAQGIKARFGSIRLQRLQDEVAEFATGIQKLKAEIIAKHFDPESIVSQANGLHTFDTDQLQQAVALIKSQFAHYRIEVKPESVALQDFAALRNERAEVLTTIASFIQAMGPLASQVPGSAPFLLQMLRWAVSGTKGSSEIQGVLDKAIAQAEKVQAQQEAEGPKPPPPDPKLLQQQLKGQQELVKVQAELQADLARTQAEVQANAEKERQQMEFNVREQAQKTMISEAARAQRPHGNGFNPGGAQ
ncbi:hypothetical protein [Myxococcus landrumensis]|uniref:Portal protein n=1 Tax=Myxococcus landrumensis TaxID=2813577 RepID=A0ABX7N5P3_9BACT|nr:hypothetical protein [Myxococcus landrumus]QSQ14055.1 hypothetical protein JY572_38035 [Myxococcus landrumus]